MRNSALRVNSRLHLNICRASLISVALFSTLVACGTGNIGDVSTEYPSTPASEKPVSVLKPSPNPQPKPVEKNDKGCVKAIQEQMAGTRDATKKPAECNGFTDLELQGLASVAIFGDK